MADLTGRTLLNRYRVDSFVGRGAMADVYKVWDSQRATYLAMKLLREDLAMDTIFLRRFRREAQALAQMQHPNIVRFYGLEEDDWLAFILMDFIEGTTLQREIHLLRQPFSAERVLEVFRAVCGAVYYAHAQGLVHCDLKPANIMIHQNGTILVTDFGMARMSELATTSVTMIGGGTFGYMAPEQAKGEKPTVQSDIYALGVLLFEMLTGGERPYTGETVHTTGNARQNVLWEQTHLPAPSPKRWNPQVSLPMEQIVLRCLDKAPERRYASALDLLAALEAAGASSGIGAAALTGTARRPGANVTAAPARNRAWRAAAWVGAFFLIAAVGGLILVGQQNNHVLAVTSTPLPSNAALPMPAPSSTATWTPSPTPTMTATQTPTATPSQTTTATRTSTATATATRRPRPTATPIPPTPTFTLEPTVSPTLEPTEKPRPPKPPPQPTPAPP